MSTDKRPEGSAKDANQQNRGIDPDTTGKPPTSGGHREPIFSDFDEDQVYEEPDRDTDYASTFQDDEFEADELDDTPTTSTTMWQQSATEREWNDPDPEELDDVAEIARQLLEADPEDDENDWQVLGAPEPRPPQIDNLEDSEEDWDDEDDYTQDLDDYSDNHEDSAQTWPLGLIAVALLALLLLAAGGYGVIQQRSAMQEEILQLQASLATAASPAEAAASREALLELEQHNAKQEALIDGLTRENNRLADIVDGLESQLKVQQQASAAAPTKPEAAAPKPAPSKPAATKAPAPKAVAPKPAPAKPAPAPAATVAASSGNWFVNFGSYNLQPIAREWAQRLKPAAGKVVLTTADKNGQTFYRVRVTGLATRDEALRVSRQLEAKYDLPKLWVGQQ